MINQGKVNQAILAYDEAVIKGKDLPPSAIGYEEILASAYLGRAVACREKKMFMLANLDFQMAGEQLPTSFGLRPLRAEEARFLRGDRVKLEDVAKKYYNRGEKHLIQREYQVPYHMLLIKINGRI